MVILTVGMILTNSLYGQDKPIPALSYQQMIGTGFATSWFKTEPPETSELPDSHLIQTMIDLRKAGFSNLRLRARADIYGFADVITDTGTEPTQHLDKATMERFLTELERVITIANNHGITPILSWIHHEAESRASAQDCENYVAWWSAVARHFRDFPQTLGFNLMTEIGIQGFGGLRVDPSLSNEWMRQAITAIRSTGDNNATRNLILTSPLKTEKGLKKLESDLFSRAHILAEWHRYASGPNQQGGSKDWHGDGSPEERRILLDAVSTARHFQQSTGIPTWLGAWMPWDNANASLDQQEIDAFATFFTTTLASHQIPWSMNELNAVYSIKDNQWRKRVRTGREHSLVINMEDVINAIEKGRKKGEKMASKDISTIGK
ncbi:cellulase family glycosylhydrolase [Kistimonas asteriae]|uniref:cellulase family glycosylhydrolase n=1 Tax=Kistimonas asteriae TaxID=517724 RepID=UPI001BA9C601|nr:cellulase family glycosylhydrolase [Kistimonas asteriae]